MNALVFWIFLAFSSSIEGLGRDHLGGKDREKEKEEDQESVRKGHIGCFWHFIDSWMMGTCWRPFPLCGQSCDFQYDKQLE